MRRTIGSLLTLAALVLVLAVAAPCVALADVVVDSADSTPISLDTRTGPRDSDGSETLSYSSLWAGDNSAKLTIFQDGVAIATGLTGNGTYNWTVQKDGTYVLTLKSEDGTELGTVTFIVKGKDSASSTPAKTGDASSGYLELATLLAVCSAALLLVAFIFQRRRA